MSQKNTRRLKKSVGLEKINLHYPNEYIQFDPSQFIQIPKQGPKVTERMREMLLNWCKQEIDDIESTQSKKIRELMYRVTKEIIYYLVFDVYSGITHQDYLHLVGLASIYIAIVTYHTPYMTEEELAAFSEKIRNQLSVDAPNFTTEQIKELSDAILPLEGVQRILQTYLQLKQSQLIAYGSYGAVCNPAFSNCDPNTGKKTEYEPDKMVTKVFFREGNYRKALKNYEIIAEKMGDPIYKAYPHTSRSVKNTSASLQQYLFSHPKHTFKNTNTIYAIRMPYLGISFAKIFHSEEAIQSVQSCPFHHIMRELNKCHSQLDRLARQRYVHGDIRKPNLLWNKETCGIHIIDFDWFGSYNEYHKRHWQHYGSPHSPPEFVVLSEEGPDRDKKIQEWASKRFASYPPVFESIPETHTADLLSEELKKVSVQNDAYLQKRVAELKEKYKDASAYQLMFAATRDYCLPSLDSYNYASCMLMFFSYVYPTSLIPFDKANQKTGIDHLSGVLQPLLGQSEEYTRLISSTIFKLVQLFRSMTSLLVEQRSNAVKSFIIMSQIYEEFSAEYNRLFAPKKPNANEKKEGGRRRKTRKRRS